MSQKTKNIKQTDQLITIAQQAGLMLMALATTVGMLELPEHPNNKIITPAQPSFAMAIENTEATNPLRREREETAPHFISYNVSQRTPARSGRI